MGPHKTDINQKSRDSALGEGASRHALAYWIFITYNTVLKYSELVHYADGESGPHVKDTKGNLYTPELVKAMPPRE